MIARRRLLTGAAAFAAAAALVKSRTASAAPSLPPMSRLSPMVAALAASTTRVRPKLHLGTFATAVAGGTAVVAIVGDSVSVGPNVPSPFTVQVDQSSLPNPVAPSETLHTLLVNKIRRDNPGKVIQFKNFAVSGQGWINLGGAATASWPTWYAVHGNTWLSYVQAAAPDLVVIALGANDGQGLNPFHVKNVLTTIAGWAKVPSIVLVAPWHASLGAGTVTPGNWQGQRANANFIRTLCSSNGAHDLMALTLLPPIGLIDLGRTQQIVEDGTDPAVQSLSQVITNFSLPAGGNYTLPQTDGDYFLDVTWPGAAGVYNFPNCTIDAGYGPTSLRQNYWNIFNQGGTGVGCQITYATGTPVTATRASGAVTDASKDIRLKLMLKNDLWLAECNGTYFINELQPRMYDTFSPLIAPAGASANPYVINAYCTGSANRTLPGIGDLQAVGSLNGPDGGNGNNHPGSFGLAHLHAIAIEAANFCAAEA